MDPRNDPWTDDTAGVWPSRNSVNGQDKLQQITGTVDVFVSVTGILRENELLAQSNKSGRVVYTHGTSPDHQNIEIGDMIFMPRTPDSNAQPVLARLKSAFASFNGKPKIDGNTPSDAMHSAHQLYVFLGIARSNVDFHVPAGMRVTPKRLDVAVRGLLNWVNHTNITVEAGAQLTWVPDTDPFVSHTGEYNPMPSRATTIKGIVYPANPLTVAELLDTAAQTVATVATVANAYRQGVADALRYRQHIIGVNGGTVVRPGEVGQLILGA